jgi:hypothetical protein
MNGYPGPPMTLGNAAAARVRLIVWCEACQHQVEPEPAEQITSAMFTEMAVRYGAETPPSRLFSPMSASVSEVKRTSGQGSIAIRTAIAAASQGKTVGR